MFGEFFFGAFSQRERIEGLTGNVFPKESHWGEVLILAMREVGHVAQKGDNLEESLPVGTASCNR